MWRMATSRPHARSGSGYETRAGRHGGCADSERQWTKTPMRSSGPVKEGTRVNLVTALGRSAGGSPIPVMLPYCYQARTSGNRGRWARSEVSGMCSGMHQLNAPTMRGMRWVVVDEMASGGRPFMHPRGSSAAGVAAALRRQRAQAPVVPYMLIMLGATRDGNRVNVLAACLGVPLHLPFSVTQAQADAHEVEQHAGESAWLWMRFLVARQARC